MDIAPSLLYNLGNACYMKKGVWPGDFKLRTGTVSESRKYGYQGQSGTGHEERGPDNALPSVLENFFPPVLP